VPPAIVPILRAARAIATLKGPRPVVVARRRWASRNPTTFTQKLLRKLLDDRRSLLTIFADKATAQEYVRSVLGQDLAPRRYALSQDPDDIDWASLPRNFVAKVNHGSGGTVIVWDLAPRSNPLPRDTARIGWTTFVVHPNDVDLATLKRLLRHWLGLKFGEGFGSNYEWAYTNIASRIVVEELLLDADNELPSDYRCFVFNGICRMIQVDSKRNTDSAAHGGEVLHVETRRDFYDTNWALLEVTSKFPKSDAPLQRPEQLDEMIGYAQQLAAETDFVRVDFYLLPSRIVFGELTNYPTSAIGRFDPSSFDEQIGMWWQLPRSYTDLPDRPYVPR
jgi:hypothetical protein